MADEKGVLEGEWLQYAKDDLESAKILLQKSDNYHISAYHSHQAIEKLFKWLLLKNDQKFPFIHDLKELLRLLGNVLSIESYFEEISFIDDLYPQLRYPTGEEITKEEAAKSFEAAEKIFKALVK